MSERLILSLLIVGLFRLIHAAQWAMYRRRAARCVPLNERTAWLLIFGGEVLDPPSRALNIMFAAALIAVVWLTR